MVKYPLLRTFAGLLQFVGFAVLAIGLFMVLLGLIALASGSTQSSQYGNPYAYGPALGAFFGTGLLASGLSTTIAGFFVVCCAESIRVVIDIEANTAQTVVLLTALGARATMSSPPATVHGSSAAAASPQMTPRPRQAVPRPRQPSRPLRPDHYSETALPQVGDMITGPFEGLASVIAVNPPRLDAQDEHGQIHRDIHMADCRPAVTF